MRNLILAIVLSATFALGYSLPSLPSKMEFADIQLPKQTQDCTFNGSDCDSLSHKITLISGQFLALEETRFKLALNDQTSTPNHVFVSSDDQVFGVIKAEAIENNEFRVLIPFCSNSKMRIIVFTDEKVPGVRLPSPS